MEEVAVRNLSSQKFVNTPKVATEVVDIEQAISEVGIVQKDNHDERHNYRVDDTIDSFRYQALVDSLSLRLNETTPHLVYNYSVTLPFRGLQTGEELEDVLDTPKARPYGLEKDRPQAISPSGR